MPTQAKKDDQAAAAANKDNQAPDPAALREQDPAVTADAEPGSPVVTPAAERQAAADTETAQLDTADMTEDQLRAEVQRLRQALIDAGHGAAAKPYTPSFVMSEGVRLDLWENGKAVDPATGDLFERDPDSGAITRTEKPRNVAAPVVEGKKTDITDQVPQPR